MRTCFCAVLVLSFVLGGTFLSFATMGLYLTQASWEAAVAGSGLATSTLNNFSSFPSHVGTFFNYSFSVGGVDFNNAEISGTVPQGTPPAPVLFWLEVGPDFQPQSSISGEPLFGFGVNVFSSSPDIGPITVVDVNGLLVYNLIGVNSFIPGFAGVLSDVPLRSVLVNINFITDLWVATHSVQPIPEPSTLLLFAVGVLVILGYGYRHRKKAVQG
ncbi:PEP-CTERM sorting domain-containing protein [Candidatus Poribacteria bacterium]|nr:PEP-CTERM sorting domain-containing protein [Candidatus Poribacteria bacterium]